MTAALPPLDWRHVPLEGRVLIEASAGTGKTWTIAQLYLRLLLEREVGVEHILVCTFTEAAAQELRERLRARLRDAERVLQRQLAGEGAADDAGAARANDPLPTWLREHTVDDPDRARRWCALVRAARLGFDRAPISTIHGFFARALREHPFGSGAGFVHGELVDEAALLADAFDDFRRRTLQVAPQHRPAYAELLAADGDAVLKLLQKLFQHPDAPRRVPDAAALASIEAAVAPLSHPDMPDALRALAKDADGSIGWIAGRAFPKRLPQLADYVASGQPLSALPKEVRDNLTADKFKKATSGPQRAAAHPLAATVVAAIEALAVRQRVLRARLLEDAFLACRVDMAALARARGQRTFSSLIGDLADALDAPGGTALADALQAEYPHALIDEFQDTDARQFAVFDAIYVGGRGGLHLIGDPKQAIYAFRGGDVAAYLEAAGRTRAQAWSIDTNRRSAPALVAALNALYGAADAPFRHPGIGYVQVGAAGPAGGRHYTVAGAACARPLAFHLAVAPDAASDGDADGHDDDAHAAGNGNNDTNPTRRGDEPAALDACAEHIVALLSDPGQRIGEARLVPHDIAVLVRSNRQVQQLRDRLAARGVPVAGAGKSSVYATALAEELVVVLHAVLHAGDAPALRAALATRLLGVDAAGLRALDADAARWDAWAQRFEHWRILWRQRGVLALVESLQRQVAAHALAERDGERRLTDLRHLGELLAEDAQHCYGPLEQLAWFDRARRRAADEGLGTDDSRQLRVESEGARVRIMTLHASKGLQFGIVLLPLAWCSEAGARTGPIACHHEDGRTLAFDLGTGSLDAALASEAAEDAQEAARILYVALTRAIHACHVYWSPAAKAGNPLQALLASVLGEAAGEDLPRALEAFAASHEGIAVQRGWRAGYTRLRLEADAPLPRRARTDLPAPRALYSLHSFSSLHRRAAPSTLVEGSAADEPVDAPVALADADEAVTDAVEAPEPALQSLAALRGPRFGNALHRVFEVRDTATDTEALHALITQSLRDEGVALPATGGESWPQRIGALVERSRATPLVDGLALAALSPEQQVAELEFHFALEGAALSALRTACARHGEPALVPPALGDGGLHGLMTGSIDLVFAHAGRYFVVDYKSNWLGDRLSAYRPDALQPAMQQADYPLQALLYTIALHRYLRQRVDDYEYDRHVGGAIYLFVRAVGLAPGAGIWRHRFDAALVDEIDAVLADATRSRVHDAAGVGA